MDELTRRVEEILAQLRSQASPANAAGMARYGINSRNTLGISVAVLRAIAKTSGRDQALSLRLWESGIHEARLLAAFVGRPDQVSVPQMENWVRDFDSWDICDQCCSNLFSLTPAAYAKALEWSRRTPEFEKRAGFALMATLAVKDKKAPDQQFEPFLEAIRAEAADNRNYVKKAVNWALRQTGKRNPNLNRRALETAEQIRRLDSPAARWIAADAIRELQSDYVRTRLSKYTAEAV